MHQNDYLIIEGFDIPKILDTIDNTDKPIFFIQPYDIYGNITARHLFFTETRNIYPTNNNYFLYNLYERIMDWYGFKKNIFILRKFVEYGENTVPNVLSAYFKIDPETKTIVIPETDMAYDYIGEDETERFISAAITKKIPSGTYNVCTGKMVSHLEIAESFGYAYDIVRDDSAFPVLPTITQTRGSIQKMKDIGYEVPTNGIIEWLHNKIK